MNKRTVVLGVVPAIAVATGVALTVVIGGAFVRADPDDHRTEMRGLWLARDSDRLRELAQSGDRWAEVYLAELLAERRSDEAIYWWTAAAEQNDTPSMMRLALFYNAEDDFVKGAAWLQRAAMLGDFEAERDYALALLNGRGVEANADQALKWFLAAVKDGDRGSHLYLAELYESGNGIMRDPFQAYVYALNVPRVADPSDGLSRRQAAEIRARIGPELSLSDRHLAQARADEIFHSLP
jgi:hypothetical protein